MGINKYKVDVPRSRGAQFEALEVPVKIDNWATTDKEGICVRDVVIHALIARIAYGKGQCCHDDITEEFLTTYNPATNLLEIDIPQESLDKLTSVEIGPKAQQYLAWLVGGFTNLRRKVQHFTISGGGAPISTGIKGIGLVIGADAVIEKVDIFGDVAGSITVDILKTTCIDYPATSGTDSITGGAPMVLASELKAVKEGAGLASWDVDVKKDDVLMYDVTVASPDITLATIVVHLLENNVLDGNIVQDCLP